MRKRSLRVLRARRQRQAEDRLQAGEQRAEPSQQAPVLSHKGRMSLFGLEMVMVALALLGAAAFLSSRPEAASFSASKHAAVSSGAEEASFLANSDAAMTRMMAAMMKSKPTNNVDRDFVALMVPHHQGAIDMAEAELRYGHNQWLRRLAQEIIVTQREEIAQMRLALASMAVSPSSGPEEASFFVSNRAAMARMMTALQIKPTHDVDRDFVALMVPHHQDGIDMAEAELSYGHNEPLLGLAQEIIAVQQQEIVVMRHALGEPLPRSVSSSHQLSSTSMHLLSSQWTPLQED